MDIRFSEIIETLIADKWGKRTDDKDLVVRDFANKVDATTACLMAILERIDAFVDSLTRQTQRRNQRFIRRASRDCIKEWVFSREKSHGPCPNSVLDWIYEATFARVGRVACDLQDTQNASFYVCGLPEKGTKARADYDKWMKRRVKPDAASTKSSKGD